MGRTHGDQTVLDTSRSGETLLGQGILNEAILAFNRRRTPDTLWPEVACQLPLVAPVLRVQIVARQDDQWRSVAAFVGKTLASRRVALPGAYRAPAHARWLSLQDAAELGDLGGWIADDPAVDSILVVPFPSERKGVALLGMPKLSSADRKLVTPLLAVFMVHAAMAFDVAVAMEQQAKLRQELALARDAAEAALVAKAEFITSMSHEVRTPLNAVIGMTGLLMDTELTAEQRDFARTIRHSGDALLNVVNDILDFSKLDADKVQLERRSFAIHECIERAIELVASRAEDGDVELGYFVDADAPVAVVGDSLRIGQVLTNLLSNAVKFTAHGEVAVSVRSLRNSSAGHELEFSVRDTGIGIPAARLTGIFDAFAQVDAATTREFGGTGLGLAICAKLIRLMGGRIWAESDGVPGKGSAFRFAVTFPAAPAPDLAHFDEVQPLLRGRKAAVLCVHEATRATLCQQMQVWGVHAYPVEDLREAVGLTRTHRFDVAIIEVAPPATAEAADLATQLFRQWPAPRPPLVALSSLSRVRGVSKHFAHVLAKPTRRAQLHDGLLAALGAPLKQRAMSREWNAFDPSLGKSTKMRVLVAEDNPVNQRVLSAMLKRFGYAADIVATGTQAIEALQKTPYQLVLMDVQMPELDGLQATARIRAELPADRQPRIVALTAEGLDGDRERCLRAGMDDYCPKPVHVEQLGQVLRTAAAALED